MARDDEARQWGCVCVHRHVQQAKARRAKVPSGATEQLPPDADISVLHKYWAGTSREFIESQYHPHKRTPLLPRSGVHVYEEPSLIDDRDVTKEQLGLHFNAASTDYDVVIEEAYTRHKTSICHAGCCSVFYARKKEK